MWMAHLVVDYQNIQPLQFNYSFSSNQLSNKISLCCNYRPKYTSFLLLQSYHSSLRSTITKCFELVYSLQRVREAME